MAFSLVRKAAGYSEETGIALPIPRSYLTPVGPLAPFAQGRRTLNPLFSIDPNGDELAEGPPPPIHPDQLYLGRLATNKPLPSKTRLVLSPMADDPMLANVRKSPANLGDADLPWDHPNHPNQLAFASFSTYAGDDCFTDFPPDVHEHAVAAAVAHYAARDGPRDKYDEMQVVNGVPGIMNRYKLMVPPVTHSDASPLNPVVASFSKRLKKASSGCPIPAFVSNTKPWLPEWLVPSLSSSCTRMRTAPLANPLAPSSFPGPAFSLGGRTLFGGFCHADTFKYNVPSRVGININSPDWAVHVTRMTRHSRRVRCRRSPF